MPADCAGLRLDQALARLFPEHSRSRLARWVKDNHISVDAHAAFPSDKMRGGERLCLTPIGDPQVLAHRPQPIALDIVYEDEALIVINKPPGLSYIRGAATGRAPS